jgi:transposase
MTVNDIDIDAEIKKVKAILAEEKDLSPALRSSNEMMILIIKLLASRLGLNSHNSSKPPSSDPNRKKTSRKKTGRKPGGQKGRVGKTLEKIDDPDQIEVIKVDRRTIPAGQYNEVGHETRQVFDIEIRRRVTEYQAQILQDTEGRRFVADFPQGVTKAVQYGPGVKAHSVYMSRFQLIPYNRIEDHFADQLNLPISAGTICRFNQEAGDRLADFDMQVRGRLAGEAVAHADETGINIGGKGHWLHCVSNRSWTSFMAHAKRGKDAMDDMKILPDFKGTLCHDHWKPYYRFDCQHALCNAHHLRELTRAWEQDDQLWAKKMMALLKEINQQVDSTGGKLSREQSKKFRAKYRRILKSGEQESPPPDPEKRTGKRGRQKKTKSRNLLERLRDYENDTLRFMDEPGVPFTNNQGENDIRMTKVQQKVSGCFRSMQGAENFCRIRGYLSTCRKQSVKPSLALELLFSGKSPDFLLDS